MVLLIFFLKKLFIAVGHHVAFVATMVAMTGCFGPFNKNVPISYCNVSLNQGYGYNPALGEHPFKIHTKASAEKYTN